MRISIPLLLLYFLHFSLISQGQEADDILPFLIPEELRRNSCATVYNEEVLLEIRNNGEAFRSVEKTVTVWNEKGDSHAEFFVVYDQYRKLKHFQGEVYGRDGKRTEKIKMSDLEDLGSFTSSFVADIRARKYKPLVNDYPYSVKYRYTVHYPSSLFIPDWAPQSSYYVSVLRSSLKVEAEEHFPFKYKEKNLPVQGEIKKEQNRTIYTWSVSGLKAVKPLKFRRPLAEITPRVLTGTEIFTVEGYRGSTKSWEEFGEWIDHLSSGRREVPPETAEHVRKLVADATDTASAICSIYDLLQEKTRYVSIQLGIGGFQPERAAKVDELGYGDCKGLSNYMVALLKEAGIRSYYTLVYAGNDPPALEEDFPANQFNHVIVCVPLQNDTLWLECTSQHAPCGFLGNFTGDRKGLIIDGDKSRLVTTQTYPAGMNCQHRRAEVRLEAAGNGTAKVRTEYEGLQYDMVESVLREEGKEQEKYLYGSIGIPKFHIDRFVFEEQKERFPSLREDLDLYLDRYMAISGDRAFLPLNLMNRFSTVPVEDTARQTDIRLKFPFVDTDTIIYYLPEGYVVESLPEPVEIEYDFGQFTMYADTTQHRLTFTRVLKIDKGTWPAADYPRFVEFYSKIVKADKAMAVLVRNR